MNQKQTDPLRELKEYIEENKSCLKFDDGDEIKEEPWTIEANYYVLIDLCNNLIKQREKDAFEAARLLSPPSDIPLILKNLGYKDFEDYTKDKEYLS